MAEAVGTRDDADEGGAEGHENLMIKVTSRCALRQAANLSQAEPLGPGSAGRQAGRQAIGGAVKITPKKEKAGRGLPGGRRASLMGKAAGL